MPTGSNADGRTCRRGRGEFERPRWRDSLASHQQRAMRTVRAYGGTNDGTARAEVPCSGMAACRRRNGRVDKNLALVGITFLITIAILKSKTGDFENASHVVRHPVSMVSRNETGTGKGDNIVDCARMRVANHAGSFAFPAS